MYGKVNQPTQNPVNTMYREISIMLIERHTWVILSFIYTKTADSFELNDERLVVTMDLPSHIYLHTRIISVSFEWVGRWEKKTK